ncbi:MAG: hypothetical protein R3344_08930 [Acidobacteriota bacterium]|nr:hypothetical protein [Acidobacteriota bacterium]
MSPRHTVVVLGVLVALSLGWGAGLWAGDDDPIESRVFRVHHRPVAEAAEVVAAILSEDAEIQMKFQRNQKILIVTDRASVLDRVGPLLESFDTPPRGVEVAVGVIVGTKTEPKTGEAGQRLPSSMYREFRDVVETLKNFTEWKNYRQIGAGAANGVEGSSLTINVEDQYQVIFDVETVEDEIVIFDSVHLQRLERDENGNVERRTLFEVEAKVRAGQTLILGGAQGPDSKEALFLTLLVNAR